MSSVESALAKANGIKVSSDDLSEKAVGQYDEAQKELQEALSNLMGRLQSNPEFSARQDFMEARAQLEGAENRISVERRKYNQTVDSYNTYRNQIPQKFTARISGFKDQPYFKSDK